MAHRKVRDARRDHAHQHAHRIVAGHDLVCVEGLAVAGMARTTLARSVQDQAMSQFLRLLKEKAARRGRAVVVVDRLFPSTRRCAGCDRLTGPEGRESLGVREWACGSCGARHDRDLNAARNLLQEVTRLTKDMVAAGRADTLNASRERGQPHTGAGGESSAGAPFAARGAALVEAGRAAGEPYAQAA